MVDTTGPSNAGHVARATDLGALPWRKSTASGTGNCVELAALPDGTVAVRNSRHPDGPALLCSRAAIAGIVAAARAGVLDDLAD